MPEGDTLRRLADRVAEKYRGETVRACIFRHPRLALVDLTGRTLESVDATGKHLLCRFSGGLTMHLHLLMQGRVHLSAQFAAPEHRRRFELSFDSGVLTGVDIPLLHVLETKRESDFVGHLGPDLCGAYDHRAAVARLATVPQMHLSAALLDQRVIAGFGNIYAVETPFICGISPFATVGSLTDVEPIVSIGAALIRTNAARGPQNTTGRQLDRSTHWVLSGRTRSCQVCGTSLRRLNGDETPWRRRTAWCPACQPAEAATVDVNRAKRLMALHPARHLVDFDDGSLVADTATAVTTRQNRRIRTQW